MIGYIFNNSKAGKVGYSLPPSDVPKAELPKGLVNEKELDLPEVTEVEVVRHVTAMAKETYGVDTGFYPLGSCTMKYNPRINEELATLEGFVNLHPDTPIEGCQGALEMMYNLDKHFCAITGMDAFTLAPAAGAHGEMTGMSIIHQYHKSRGDTKRNKVLIPDSAHGTNPASAVASGFETVTIPSNSSGGVDMDALDKNMTDEIAGLMLTNPNTAGIFDPNICEIARIVHSRGGLLYYDGANLNALMGISRPGDFGFDVVHLNLHKTFSTPHGGGGPGSAPVGVKDFLKPYLPVPHVAKNGDTYYFDYNMPKSMGRIRATWGNFLVLLKAYCYIRTMGPKGLKQASEHAVLSANYIRVKINDLYPEGFPGLCMHECVMSGSPLKKFNVLTKDVSKRLMDYGFHPPTNYFPLIIPEAIMIEPTESESKEMVDSFIAAMRAIYKEAEEGKIDFSLTPLTKEVSRVDETKAARTPILRWTKKA
ncbi:MAG TPA: aminomethyl-transferring glycine dehydrogenase subunit GcvPB [Caldisericia bacterium]|nr:MAG: putative glycine dehydrogenase (decarboxylating) subunit 2 [bacterium ADurb.Bin132]HNY61701.1 aminomethyl-transferring glycine dehydrogenase subunit GcvPB [Caldisericia bacterium]HOC80039.1 aminomethyl-transferring glycine dehydrogenase subunit GcvPB [Caldisericia bacterium]HOG70701.1 aminomethyl-transferring glycine dehydrogenase subunit GcvPB [Caldisericia bacterium]HPA65089.1 aminomethyl-transferring glycine dehydrogenase subunit GcvPB [Caldisericia bacterium]